MADDYSAETIPAPRRRWTAGRIARWAGRVLAALVLLVAAILVGLNTGPGRAFLVRQANGYQLASGLGVHIGRIEGSIYGRMVIRDLAVSDTRGVFLTSPAVVLDWRPFKYIHSVIDVREASAGTIRLLRSPLLKPTPSDPNAPTLPDIDLSVRVLRIDRFVIEPPVDGKRHIVSLAGSAAIADRRAQIDARAGAVAAPGVAGGDRATLKLDAVPDDNRFDVDLKLNAPAGGLVDSYAGLGRPLTASIDGTGDWRNWNGQVTATAGGERIAGLRIRGTNGRFLVKGAVRPGIILTGPAARLTEPEIALDLDATLADRKVDMKLAAHSAAFAVTAGGRLDLAQSRFGSFHLDGKLLKPGAIADNVAGRDVTFVIGLDGPFATPTVDYRLAAGAIGFGATSIEGLAAAGVARIDADRILVPVHATARRVAGLNAAAGGLLTNLRIDGDLAYAGGKVLSDNLHLRSDRIDATAVIVADIAHGTYTGALKGRVNDYEVAGLGRVNLVTDAHLVPGANGGFGIRGRVRIETRRLDNASVKNFLGGNAVITADVGFDPQGAASVTNLRVNAPDFRVLDGHGSYRLSDGRIAFEGRAVSRAYGPLSVTTTGTVANPVVHLRAARPGLGVGLANVEAELTGGGAGYRVRARGGTQYGPFTADVLIRAGQGPLAVDISSLQFAGVTVRGRVQQTAAGPFAGTLALSGSGLNGTVRLAAAGANQRADIDLRATDFRVPGTTPIRIGNGLVRATVTVLPNGPSVTGDVSLGGVTYGTTTVSRARAHIDYAGGRGRVQLVAAGQSGVPFDIAAQAAIAPDRILFNARGTANSIPFRFAAPGVVTRAGPNWQLAPVTLVLPQGQATVQGRFGSATELSAQLRRLDLSIIEAFAPGLGIGGQASGTVTYSALPGAAVPSARARIDIAGFTRTSAATVSAPVDIALLATLSPSGGDARAVIRRGAATIGRLQARLAPLPGGAGDSWTERLLSAPLSGGIRYNGPADVLFTLGGLAGQTLTGPIAIGADFGGHLDQPTLTGVVRADALRYENETYGTVLSAMAIRGRFTQSRFELTQLSARAGDGTVSARGTVGLDAAGGFPINLTATLDRAQLARSDALGATVSGTVAVTNSKAAGGLIKGDLHLPEVRYQIVQQGAAEVPELTGVRRKGAPPPGAQPAAASSVPSIWKLDLRVRADNKVYVSGMGLESEWQTDLHVGGTSSSPEITGKLEIVRGTFSFNGRRFDVSTGEITFVGGQVSNPEINIAADTTVEGLTATINITGRAQAPQIAFTSTPNLPQDEVLSRLLFGSSVTNLSPSQAIQLAAALNGLRPGTGHGLNPLGKLRSATGIDRLRILGADKTAGRGTALAAGQYISNDIYVEVITDARGFTATQIEIAISRALSILSSTGSFGGSSVQLRYTKDY